MYHPRNPRASPLWQCAKRHGAELRDSGRLRRAVEAQVLERFIECGDPHHGFARIYCDACRHDYLLAYSCKTRYFCPSCHQKRVLLYGEWVEENILEAVPHRQYVFTVPRLLRPIFGRHRAWLGELCRIAARLLAGAYAEAAPGARPGLILFVQTFGDLANFNPHGFPIDSPIAIAINPQGKSAYVASVGSATVTELGGTRTLTGLDGSGIGRVRSAPAGIDCGTLCLAQYVAGTQVTLTPVAESGSQFTGWTGNADCTDGIVTLTSDINCRATFTSNTPPPSNTNPPPGSGCFIATAAYGSAVAPEVELLRAFRDRQLMTHAPGRAFVSLYYRYSPAVAEAIRPHDSARAAVRAMLWPLVGTIKHPGGAGLGIVLIALAIAARRKIRFSG